MPHSPAHRPTETQGGRERQGRPELAGDIKKLGKVEAKRKRARLAKAEEGWDGVGEAGDTKETLGKVKRS